MTKKKIKSFSTHFQTFFFQEDVVDHEKWFEGFAAAVMKVRVRKLFLRLPFMTSALRGEGSTFKSRHSKQP